MSIFRDACSKVRDFMPATVEGQIADVVGLVIECDEFAAPVGASCEIECRHSGDRIEGEVVGFRGSCSIIMPYGEMRGFSRGDRVRMVHAKQTIPVGDELIGRVLNARGEPIDGKPAPFCQTRWPVYMPAPSAMDRPMISEAITTGVKAVDGLFTCGRGQRMGIFSGSGVGKSTLLGMITRNTNADVVVVGLVGERGREVREFIERDLGEEGRKRAVVICETSDRPPLMRVKAAFTATAVAEYFRARGKNVMLLVDSITRMAFAQREIGLSSGEPPTTRGYPPSVFNLMPRLLERSGATNDGSITAFYTVLVEGDDVNEPIADTVRGILDGHVWLTRDLANKGHFPAVSVDHSISRLMTTVAASEHRQAAMRLRELYTSYREAEDLINIGAYRTGSNAVIDEAITLAPGIKAFLRQETGERFTLPETVAALRAALVAPQQGRQGNRPPLERPAGIAPRPGGNVPQANERTLGRVADGKIVAPPPEANEHLVRTGQQRMPPRQPPAEPGRHPVHAPAKP